jgi:protease-4
MKVSFSRERGLAWAILLILLISIPVGLFCRYQGKSYQKTSDTKSMSAFLPYENRLVVLKLNGLIAEEAEADGFLPSLDMNTPNYVRKQLRKAAKDDKVKGILLRINSPGGTVATSQELFDAVQTFRKAGKPIVVSMGDVAASGGYYIAAGADKIVAAPGTLTGSIGVIIHLLNLQEIERKIGIAPVVIKSGSFKDIGSMDRPMTKEEKALLESIIMDSYDQFVEAVAKGRNMDKAVVKKLADGRIYSGRQAYSVKLVDQLGSYEDALALLQSMAKERFQLKDDLKVDDGGTKNFFSQLLQSSVRFGGMNKDLLGGFLPQSMQARFLGQPMWVMQ